MIQQRNQQLRKRFATFWTYDWHSGMKKNPDAITYENAVLTWNGVFIMLVVNVVLLIYYSFINRVEEILMIYGMELPFVLLVFVGSRLLYFKFRNRPRLMLGLTYVVGTGILLFCAYLTATPGVRASFYAFFLAMTLQTTLIVDVPWRKAYAHLLWTIIMLVAIYRGIDNDVLRQQSVLIHGIIVAISTYLFGCFTSWRKMQGFDDARELLYISTHDWLTGLKNRDKLYEDYDAWAAEDEITGVLIFDINSFKKLNDTHGHIFGDQAIQYVAGILQKCEERYKISFYRYGGDEFVGLVCRESEREPQRLIPHIKHRVCEEDLCTASGVEITIQVSGGYANYTPGVSLEQCVNAADEKMYEDKEQMKKDGLVSMEKHVVSFLNK